MVGGDAISINQLNRNPGAAQPPVEFGGITAAIGYHRTSIVFFSKCGQVLAMHRPSAQSPERVRCRGQGAEAARQTGHHQHQHQRNVGRQRGYSHDAEPSMPALRQHRAGQDDKGYPRCHGPVGVGVGKKRLHRNDADGGQGEGDPETGADQPP